MIRILVEPRNALVKQYRKFFEFEDVELDFTDAFDVFAGFFQNAAAEYSHEAGRVANIGSKVASEAAHKLRVETRDTIDDMAARTVM